MFKKVMRKIIIEILTGAMIITLGALLYFEKTPSVYGHAVPRPLGTFIIFAGIFWILYVLLRQRKIISDWKESKEHEKVVICPKCLKPEYAINSPNLKCEICGISLEEMDGFYERHPELKENQT